MSWLKLKTAVSKAVEAGNSSNITRNLKNYADTVVQHAGREEQGKGSNPTSKDNLQSYIFYRHLPAVKTMAESDSPLTDAEKKAFEERVLQNKELKEENSILSLIF
ncbi:hypothetical protein V6N11_000512 [Hibiscus sabdariffa]|uniref:Uncharacterized protein n=2 Tax=Hibiscus sabdariffa TaxID=183260 RepID=A0ABR2BTG2_9ROSI